MGHYWIWAVFTLLLVGWRWLLVKWTRSEVNQLEAALAEVNQELESASNDTTALPAGSDATVKPKLHSKDILKEAQNDPPIWEDWSIFGSDARKLWWRSHTSTILK
jgi:hypothetical protein